MPGALWNSFRQGDRTEYLAAYLLSALGLASKVPREEDVGVDFHCNLASNFGDGLLQFFSPFNVQIKSSPTAACTVQYGGIKNGRCRDREVRWLLSQTTPFFLGIVSKEEGTIRLYSTALRWLAKLQGRPPFKITFVTNSGSYGEPIEADAIVKTPSDHTSIPDITAREEWRIPLGPPALCMDIRQAEDPVFLLNARQHFKDFIYLDARNGVSSGMGLPSVSWPFSIIQNENVTSFLIAGLAIGWAPQLGDQTDKLVRAIAPLVASLQRTHALCGNHATVAALNQMLDLIPASPEYNLVRETMQGSMDIVSNLNGESPASPTAGEEEPPNIR